MLVDDEIEAGIPTVGLGQAKKFHWLGGQGKGIEQRLAEQNLPLKLRYFVLPCHQSITAEAIGHGWGVCSGVGKEGFLVIVHELGVEVSQF